MHVVQFSATQPFVHNCPHSSGKCPGLGKNEKLIILVKAELAWLLCWFGQLIELTYPNCDLVFLNHYKEKNTAFAKETPITDPPVNNKKECVLQPLSVKISEISVMGALKQD